MKRRPVLSADEVAALVAAGGEARCESPARARRPRRVREIDFSRPSKFTQEQQRRLERAHETFCRTVSTRLSAELRSRDRARGASNVAPAHVGDALAEHPASVALRHRRDRAARHGACSSAPSCRCRARACSTRMLGGPTPATRRARADRDRADARAAALQDAARQAVADVAGAARPQLGLAAIETQPAGASCVPPSEPTLAVTSSCQAGATPRRCCSSSRHRAIAAGRSTAAVEPQLRRQRRTRPGRRRRPCAARWRRVEIEVRAEVAAVELPLDEVLALRPGDIAPPRRPRVARRDALRGRRSPVQRARPGRSGRRRAVQVLGRGWRARDDRRGSPASRLARLDRRGGRRRARAVLPRRRRARPSRSSVSEPTRSPTRPLPAVATTSPTSTASTGGNVFLIAARGARKLAAAMMGDATRRAVEDERAHRARAVRGRRGDEPDDGRGRRGDERRARPGGRDRAARDATCIATAAEALALEDAAPHVDDASRSRVLGEPCRLVQLVPNAFVVRIDARARRARARRSRPASSPARRSRSPRRAPRRRRCASAAELGRDRMPIGRPSALPPGAVVELDRERGGPDRPLRQRPALRDGRLCSSRTASGPSASRRVPQARRPRDTNGRR